MICLSEPNLCGNEKKYLNQCIDSTFVSSVGEFVTRLEQMSAKAAGAEYAVASSAGTTGLQIALLSCGVKRDELVIIPSFTFIATANAVAHCGAEPWCIDIDEDSWTLSPKVLERELESKAVFDGTNLVHKRTGKRVAAIMPVYTLGMPADMDRINQIAKRYHLPVAADAAAAIGATYKGESLGKLADMSVFSYNGNKTVTCGGGGVILSNNKEWIDLARHLSTTARCGKEYIHDMVGYNFRMTNLQAAVGCAQLENLEKFVERKRSVHHYYKEQFAEIENVRTFPEAEWAEGACWFSGIVLPSEKKARELISFLNLNEIEGRTFWRPVHMQKPYQSCERSEMGICEALWNRIVTLPCSTNITDAQLKLVSDTVKGWKGL